MVWRDSMSISPDCSAWKRVLMFVRTKSTFSGSPKTAEATARQTSTSKPCIWPLASAVAKPGVLIETPQISLPRALTVSRVVAALAVNAVRPTAMPAAVAQSCRILFFIIPLPMTSTISASAGHAILFACLLPHRPAPGVNPQRHQLHTIVGYKWQHYCIQY
ncbi:hypothetical protein D3C72_1668350 [compost metagenome]